MDRRQAGVHHHRPGGVVAGDPAVAARHGGGLAEGLIGEGDGDVERQEPPDEAVEIEPGQRAAEIGAGQDDQEEEDDAVVEEVDLAAGGVEHGDRDQEEEQHHERGRRAGEVRPDQERQEQEKGQGTGEEDNSPLRQAERLGGRRGKGGKAEDEHQKQPDHEPTSPPPRPFGIPAASFWGDVTQRTRV